MQVNAPYGPDYAVLLAFLSGLIILGCGLLQLGIHQTLLKSNQSNVFRLGNLRLYLKGYEIGIFTHWVSSFSQRFVLYSAAKCTITIEYIECFCTVCNWGLYNIPNSLE